MSAMRTGEETSSREGSSTKGAAKFVIRRFRVNDVAEICEVIEESPAAARWSATSVKQLAALAGGMILVTEAGSKLTGLLMARQIAGEAEILNCAIRRKYRRQGQARALLTAAFESFCATGVVRVFLEVRESNWAALKLYERYGFRETQRRPRYYREPDEAAICMEVGMEKKVTG